MFHLGPCFGSPCPAQARNSRILVARLTRQQGSTKTPHQMLLIKRLTKVTNDPVVHSAGLVKVVGVGSNENRRNRLTLFDEVFMELEPGHRWHMNVSDQAGRLGEMRLFTFIDRD